MNSKRKTKQKNTSKYNIFTLYIIKYIFINYFLGHTKKTASKKIPPKQIIIKGSESSANKFSDLNNNEQRLDDLNEPSFVLGIFENYLKPAIFG